ncbi:EpsG family protein [Brevibacterium sp. JSBI002]|uniref:EpsG family protein n=1 Tax=Brevibacterium sp. JSBI002 TaxID=2886045 RepID=UPI0022308172|nr:EpsG family protein [Brevibacterium sp. JSBI002]UZD62011.1 EpsG family protein [Brevibacterium sp. JSBI002]
MIAIWFALTTVWVLMLVFSWRIPKLRHWSNAVLPLVSLVLINTIVAAVSNYEISDKAIYSMEFQILSFAPADEIFYTYTAEGREPAFLILSWLIGLFTHDPKVYFFVVALLGSTIMAAALLWLLRSAWQVTLVYYITFCFGFFTGYSSYLLRQGLSLAFIILGLVALCRRTRLWKMLVLLAVASLFHWSAIPAALFILGVRLLPKAPTAFLIAVWTLFSLLYLSGLNATLLAPFASSSEELETYTDPANADLYTGGTNRLDFWILGFCVVVFGYVVLRKFDNLPEWYGQLFHAFVLLNTYYLALGFVYYSDRVAAYSWSIVPLVLVVPALSLTGWKQGWSSVALMAGFLGWSEYIGLMDNMLKA